MLEPFKEPMRNSYRANTKQKKVHEFRKRANPISQIMWKRVRKLVNKVTEQKLFSILSDLYVGSKAWSPIKIIKKIKSGTDRGYYFDESNILRKKDDKKFR